MRKKEKIQYSSVLNIRLRLNMSLISLPYEVLDIIFKELHFSSEVYLNCIVLNKEYHTVIQDIFLPRLAVRKPNPKELIKYIDTNISYSKKSMYLLMKDVGWYSIESLSLIPIYEKRYIFYTKLLTADLIGQTYTSAALLDKINAIEGEYILDPVTYRKILEKRISAVTYYPDYVNDMLMTLINEILLNFNKYGTVKWTILYLIMDAV
jgi:hypothetical protein